MLSKLDKDFRYSVDYDYDTHYSCEESGCDEEGICRCGIIYNPEIKSININNIVGSIYSEYFDNSLSTERDNKINSILFGVGKEIDLYTIDRILRHFKIWNPLNWEMEIEGGYYGQEIGKITINVDVGTQIESCLDKAFSIDELNSRIEYLLTLEYGHLLPELEKSQYEIIDINKDDIIFGSDSQLNKVSSEDLSHYSDINYNGIRGIVKSNNGSGWRLIDGYHRCYETKKNTIKVLKAF